MGNPYLSKNIYGVTPQTETLPKPKDKRSQINAPNANVSDINVSDNLRHFSSPKSAGTSYIAPIADAETAGVDKTESKKKSEIQVFGSTSTTTPLNQKTSDIQVFSNHQDSFGDGFEKTTQNTIPAKEHPVHVDDSQVRDVRAKASEQAGKMAEKLNNNQNFNYKDYNQTVKNTVTKAAENITDGSNKSFLSMTTNSNIQNKNKVNIFLDNEGKTVDKSKYVTTNREADSKSNDTTSQNDNDDSSSIAFNLSSGGNSNPEEWRNS